MSDDKKRRLNIYSHACGFWLLSEDLDQGVTPFGMPCQCGGDMHSHFYSVAGVLEEGLAQIMKAHIVWYKPDDAEVSRMTPAMQEHVGLGGLQFRPNASKADYLKKLLARCEA